MEKSIFKTGNKEIVKQKLDKYFDICKKQKKIPSMTGLAMHLKTTRQRIINYQHTDEFGDLLAHAKLRCENFLEEQMIKGTPPTGIIFILKNNYGWKDRVEVDQTINGTISLSTLFDQAAKTKALQSSSSHTVVDGEFTEKIDEVLLDDTIKQEHDQQLPADLF